MSVPVAAGDVVVRAGDPGDQFYIVADGEFDVLADGADRKVGGATTSARSRCFETCRAQQPSERSPTETFYALEQADFSPPSLRTRPRVAGRPLSRNG